MNKKLSIIIVSWNVCHDVLQCIDSIYQCPPTSAYEIILVDNASADATVEQVRSRFPDVTIVESGDNLGFAAANNKGIEIAGGEYLFILNPDTLALPESFDKLTAFMDANPDVGLCGPQVLNADRSIQRSVRRFPNFGGMFYRFTLCKYAGLFRRAAQHWKMKEFDHRSQQDVEQLIGAAIIARTSLIQKLGGFDERFFMYYEEVDLCLRTRQAGMRVVFYPAAQIVHLGGQSARQIPAKVKFMMLQSLVLFMKKHHFNITGFLALVLFKIGVLLRQTMELLFCLVGLLVCIGQPHRFKKYRAGLKTSFVFLAKYSIRFLLV